MHKALGKHPLVKNKFLSLDSKIKILDVHNYISLQKRNLMKGILRRFKYYMIGFTIGLIFVVFFFQNRGCAWLPGNRVKQTIVDKVWVIPETETEVFKREGIGKPEIMEFIQDGKVDFSNSIKKQNEFPKAYIIRHVLDEKEVRLQFSLYEDSYISIIHKLKDDQKAFKATKLEGLGSFIRIPRDSALVYIDKDNYARCSARFLTNKKQDLLVDALKKSGKINFDKSDLSLPKAEQYIEFQIGDSSKVEAKTIFLESRINFKAFFWEDFEPDC